MKTTTSNTKSGHNGNTSVSMKCYFNDINHFALLSREEEIELGTRIQNDGDSEALEKMINSNLKLVVKIANDYSKFGLAVEDLVSEGNIGLMKAAEKFDPKFGVRFSTYAAWWIKQMIKRALGNQSRTIRLPLHVLQKLRELDRTERELGDELGRDPRVGELAEKEGLPRKKVAELRRVSQPVVSFDEHESEDGEDHLHIGAYVCDDSTLNPCDAAAEKDLNEHLAEVLCLLNPREQEILTSRFGIGGGERETLEQVGARFGVTRERIRQIQKAAISKLRYALQRREQPIQKNSRSKQKSHLMFEIPTLPEAISA